jgi:hypothetical protein
MLGRYFSINSVKSCNEQGFLNTSLIDKINPVNCL